MTGTPTIERKGLTGRTLVAVAPEDTLGEVAEKLLAEAAGTTLVVDSGRVIGVLSSRDLLRAVAERVHPSDGRVREWMSPTAEHFGEDGISPRPALDVALCELAWAVGSVEPCPGEPCAFWWRGGCTLAGLGDDIARDPQLARVFLDLRGRLQASVISLPGLAS